MSTTTLRLPENILKTLKLISIREHSSVNKILNNLILEYLDDYLDSKDAEEALTEMEGKAWVELDEFLQKV